MECVICGKDYEAKRSTSLYCGAKCRKLAFQNDGVTVPENGKGFSVPRTIIDANGTEHPIDFETRRKNHELLESWANEEGSEWQRRLGELARFYQNYPKRKAEQEQAWLR